MSYTMVGFPRCLLCCTLSSYVSAVRRSVTEASRTGSGPSPVETYIKEKSTVGFCKPLHWKSSCPPDDYRGVLIYFHGFGGCADQGDEIGPQIAAETCWDVFAPVNPGHSKAGKPIPCSTGNCTTQIDDWNGFDMSDYPTGTGWEYKQFANDMTHLAQKERKYRCRSLGLPPTTGGLAAMGLSLGSAIGFRAMVDNPKAFQRVLLVNPFLGAGQEEEDYTIRACNDEVVAGKKTNQECAKETRDLISKKFGSGFFVRALYRGANAGIVRMRDMRVMRDTAKVLPASISKEYLSEVIRWDGKCQNVWKLGATGTCVIMQRHFMAVHTFAYEALEASLKSDSWYASGKPPVVQFVLTEADGVTRNGLVYSAAKRLKCIDPKQHINICMWPFKESAKNAKPTEGAYWDKKSIVPHAMIGLREHAPGEDWWNVTAHDKWMAFLKGKDDITDHVEWEPRDKSKCVALPLLDGAIEKPWLRHILLPEADGSWDDTCYSTTTTTTTTIDPYGGDYSH